MQAILKDFIVQESLPETYIDTALKWFAPIAEFIFEHQNSAKKPVVIGINGCQGSGKSTLTALLCQLLSQHYQKVCIGMSIDDFYLSKAARIKLSETIHPLLATRGVPGTHDIALLLSTLSKLKENKKVCIPRFDKSSDDLYPKEKWQAINYPVDIILLEGWCVGIGAQTEDMLSSPINTLEKEQDPKGRWRNYVNQQLKGQYAKAFDTIDIKVMLQSPSFESVYQWRCEQEHKLIQKRQKSMQGPQDNNSYSGLMNDAQIATFIQYYERLTTHALATMPTQSDVVISLDDSRGITNCVIK